MEGMDMKTHILGSIGAAIVLLAAVVTIAAAAPQISIYTDSDSYQAGDTIEVSLAAENEGEAINVDVYMGLLTPDGALFTLGELAWSKEIQPWIENIHVPSGFSMDRTPYFSFDLPCEMPPIHQPGEFWLLAGTTYPGTLEFVSDIALTAFDVRAVPSSHCYVDADAGDDTNDGSKGAPWWTIYHALDSVLGCEIAPVTIHVAKSEYEHRAYYPLNMRSWVSILGEGPGTVIHGQYWGGPVISCVNVRDLTIDGLEITGGDAVGMGYGIFGGGIFCENSSPLISNNFIHENYGGHAVIGGGGGGIYCYGGSPTIAGNMIFRNTATLGGGPALGGGIFCEDSAPIIVNNLILENTASQGGSIAIRNRHCIDPPQIYNNTILDNSSGVYNYNLTVTVEIVDCIVWGVDRGPVLNDVSASYCCIEGGYPGEGNIDQDPMLVFDSQWWSWKRYLDPDSPCIDAGSRSAEDAGLSGMTTQEDGTPDTGTVDMGSHYAIE